MKKQLTAFLLGLFLTSPAWADSTIDLLGAGAALTGTEKLPMFQTANPAVTTTPSALKTFVTATGVVTSVTNSDGTLTFTGTSAVVGSLALGHANTWTGAQSFTNGDLSLLGATSGNTLLEATAVAGAGTVATFPANTGTVAELNLAQTWSAAQTFNNNDLLVAGATSGATTLAASATASGTATFPANTGTVAELNLAQTFSAIQTFSATNGIVYSGAATGTQVACLGLDASNNVIKSAAACGSGGGGTPGGPTTAIQFNNSGAFGGDAGFEYLGQGVNNQVTLAQGTITTNVTGMLITATWNAAGITFDAPFKMNVTKTAASVQSLLFDFQVGGNIVLAGAWDSTLIFGAFGEQFSVGGLPSNGMAITNRGNILSFESTAQTRIFQVVGGGGGITSQEALINSNTVLSWNEATNLFGTPANTLSLANSASAQSLKIYNTTNSNTSPTNFERATMDWSTTSNVLTIGSQAGGTGTGRPMMLVSAGQFNAATAAIPACAAGTKGSVAVVSDATAPTYNATYTSGGAIVALVVCNGTNWVTQ